jgi:hypothetical protein
VYRRALLSRKEDGDSEHIANSTLCVKHGIPSPSAFRSSLRLKYLHRFLSHAPPSLQALVWEEYKITKRFSWLALCFADLSWLKTCTPALDGFPPPHEDQAPWFSFIVDLTSEFFKALANAVDASALQVTDKVPIVKDRTCQCCHCGRYFSSNQELAAHCFAQHAVKSSIRKMISGTTCKCCMINYQTRSRIHHHVAYRSKRCLRFYQQVAVMEPEDEVESLEVAEALRVKAARNTGSNKLYFSQPSFRMPGPIYCPS